MEFDQLENLRGAILKKKARIAEIERTLNRPPKTDLRWGMPLKVSQRGRLRLEEERQHLLFATEELERELARLKQLRSEAAAAPNRSTAAIDLNTKLESRQRFQTLTVKETAEALRVSRATVYRMLDNGRLKRASLGAEYGTRRAARVTRESVNAALEPES